MPPFICALVIAHLIGPQQATRPVKGQSVVLRHDGDTDRGIRIDD
jgi:hypothetical protein